MDGTTDQSSVNSSLTTLSSASLHQTEKRIIIEGFKTFQNHEESTEEGEEDGEEDQNIDQEDAGVLEATEQDELHQVDSPNIPRKVPATQTTKSENVRPPTHEDHREECGASGSIEKDIDPPIWREKTLRKRSTFQGITRRNKKKQTKSSAVQEEQVTISIGRDKENGGVYLCLVEGFVDMFHSDEEEKFPAAKGRFHELVPLNSMHEGEWTVCLKRGSSSIPSKNSLDGPSSRLILRHDQLFRDEYGHLSPDAPLSQVVHESFEIRAFDPAPSRESDMVSQGVVANQGDVCFMKVAAISLFCFKGFSSTSECRKNSRQIARSVLSPGKKTLGTEKRLVKVQMQHDLFGELAGATYLIPEDEKACYFVVWAIEPKSNEIVAVDVIFTHSKKIPVFVTNENYMPRTTTHLTKVKLDTLNDCDDKLHSSEKHSKRLCTRRCSKNIGSDQAENGLQSNNTPPPAKRQKIARQRNSNVRESADTSTQASNISQQPLENEHSSKSDTNSPREQNLNPEEQQTSMSLPAHEISDTKAAEGDNDAAYGTSDTLATLSLVHKNPVGRKLTFDCPEKDGPLIVAESEASKANIPIQNACVRPTPSVIRRFDFSQTGRDSTDVKMRSGQRNETTGTRTENFKARLSSLGLFDATPRVHFALEPKVFPMTQHLVTPAPLPLSQTSPKHMTPQVSINDKTVVDSVNAIDDLDIDDYTQGSTDENETKLFRLQLTLFHDVFFGCHDESAVVDHDISDKIDWLVDEDERVNLAELLHCGPSNINDDNEAPNVLVDWLAAILLVTLLFALLYWLNFSVMGDPWKMVGVEIEEKPESSHIWSMLGFAN
ncbi:hypothetical protein ACA910_014477 [Epithemia clementina (nom. ined.)]